MVLAQTIVDAPKNGAMSRAAAISAPRVETPTTKTSTRSRRCFVATCGIRVSVPSAGRVPGDAAAGRADVRSGAGAPGARAAATGAARALSQAAADAARADPPHAVAVPHPRLPPLPRLRVRPADPRPAAARGGLERPGRPRAVPRLAGPAPAAPDVALLPVAGLPEQRPRGRGAERSEERRVGKEGR